MFFGPNSTHIALSAGIEWNLFVSLSAVPLFSAGISFPLFSMLGVAASIVFQTLNSKGHEKEGLAQRLVKAKEDFWNKAEATGEEESS